MIINKKVFIYGVFFLLLMVTTAYADPVAGLFNVGTPTLLSDNSADILINVDGSNISGSPTVTPGDILVTITGITTIGATTVGSGTKYNEVTAFTAVKIATANDVDLGPIGPDDSFGTQNINLYEYTATPLTAADIAWFNWETGQININGMGPAEFTFTPIPGTSNDGTFVGAIFEDVSKNFTRDSTIQNGIAVATDGALRLKLGIILSNSDFLSVRAPFNFGDFGTIPFSTAVDNTNISFDGTIISQNWPGLFFNNNITGGNGGFSSRNASSNLPAFDNLDFTLTAVSPCIELIKEVSPDGAAWFDANDPRCTDAPGTLDPAEYRLTIRNCGGEVLTEVLLNDSVLGISDYAVGSDIPVGGEIVLTSADIDQLYNPDLCPIDPNNPNVVNGGLRNIARVDAEGITSGIAVFDEDPACIRCICIELIKEVSPDGATWFDANHPECADAPTTDDIAGYRLTIRNCGTEVLTEVLLNDSVLGISDYAVGSDIPVGGEIVLTSADIDQLYNPDLCPIDPNNPNVVNGGLRNIARVDAEGITSGIAVFDEDPACIRCRKAVGGCRMTGGHVEFCSEGSCTLPGDAHTYNASKVTVRKGNKLVEEVKVTWYTVGGQIGAPHAGCLSAPDPKQPYGDWQHTHHAGSVSWPAGSQQNPSFSWPAGSFSGGFSFHSGTAAAPDQAYIKCISCADPGWCVQARCAPFKQLFWEGTGVFHNLDSSTKFPGSCSVRTQSKSSSPTIHYYRAHVGDFGESIGNSDRQKPLEQCEWISAGASILNGILDGVTVLPWPLDFGFGDKGGQSCSKYPNCDKCGECPTENCLS